jgi:hypothetical protein
MDWRIAVGQDGVRDLGRTDRYPELAFVDHLLDRLSHHRPPPAPAVGADLRLLGSQSEFDMLDGWTLHRHGGREQLCIGWLPGTDVFIFTRMRSRLRLRSVREGPKAGCPGKTSS